MTSDSLKKCRICGGLDLKPKYRFQTCCVELCCNCGFAQVAEMPTATELKELYGPEYFEKGKYVGDQAVDNEQHWRLQWLVKCGVQTGARMLDAGCATGDFIGAAKKEYDIWGMDISEHAIEEVKTRFPDIGDRLHAGLVEDSVYPDAFFDVITLWDVIEHVWNPVEVIANLVPKLKPGGHLIISTPNIGAFTAKMMGKRWAFMTPPEHLGFFNRSTMRQLITKNGLSEGTWVTRGKSVNLAFLTYKLRRIFPLLVPEKLVHFMSSNRLGRVVLYVPTEDIQYVSAVKSGDVTSDN